jgi:hypothetical protein
MATAILTMFAATIGALALGVQHGHQFASGTSLATQHARVVLQRIQRAIGIARANEQFPGCVAFSQRIGTWTFPDTLVVWRGDVTATDPAGLPLMKELVIYCPDPTAPQRLLEITVPNDTSRAPAWSDTTAWNQCLATIKNSNSATKVELTDRLRTAAIPEAANGGTVTAARFDVLLRPSEKSWQDYKSGKVAWDSLAWAQGVRGAKTGLRQVCCRIELQLSAGAVGSQTEPLILPFAGSAANYFALKR